MTYYQGDDINFSIDIKQVANSSATDWSYFPSVVVYLYTHTSHIAKFKNTEDSGYVKMELNGDSSKYHARLTPEQTRLMEGALRMSIRVTDGGGDVSTKDLYTGIQIVSTPIKYE